MKIKNILFLVSLLISCTNLYSQDEFLYSSDGKTILRQRELIQDCLKNLQKKRTDQTAVAICQCQVSLLNRQFTQKQFKKYTTNGIISLSKLIEEDSVIAKKIDGCIGATGQSTLLIAQTNREDLVSNCMMAIQKNTKKTLDSLKLKSFCACHLELIKSKKISDNELESLKNPNSLLFYEMLYKCGNPFEERIDEFRKWNSHLTDDVKGPVVDTVSVLNLNAMTYVKLKTGSLVQFWLFDTGATDFLINTDMEKILKEEKVLDDNNYLGIGEYEMANGIVDSCRRYKINDVRIGHFSINNIIVAVSEKARKIIVGKTLLNKFQKWSLNNAEDKLVLWK